MSSASDYIQKLKLAIQRDANNSADDRKFRAPTRDSVYDPNRIVKNSVTMDNFKNPTPFHNTFAAKILSSNRAKTTG